MPDSIRLDDGFRQIIEAVPNAMIVVSRTGRIMMMNGQGQEVFGYGQNEISGWAVELLVPEWPSIGHPKDAGLPSAPGLALHARRKDGSEFLVEIGLNQIETPDGPMVLAAIVDISRRKQEDERIRTALHEKDTLLGEIHHRVKNNLQIVYSLLGLQAARIADQALQDQLYVSQNRILSMALIHQTLYGSKDFERVDFALFIGALLPALIRSCAADPDRISIRVDMEPVRLPIDIAVPCGLVVNELITNALKHAFRHRDRGEIRIALTRQPGNDVLLSVSDNGIGLPGDLDIHKTETLGLQLVNLLASQLDGEISFQHCHPTRFSLRFSM
jgi:PAS domain S-box-containing protein